MQQNYFYFLLDNVSKYGMMELSEQVALVYMEIDDMTLYIQRKDSYGLETVDEAQDRKEAQFLVQEYQFGDFEGFYYVSTKPCKQWATRQ